MITNTDARNIGLMYIMTFAGKWYKWGGNNPLGFDCSGLAVEYLKAVGYMPRKGDITAQGIWDKFSPTCEVPNPYGGCLVLYRSLIWPDKIVHVEICLNEYQAIGASGGGSATLTVEDAIRDNAFIKVRPIKSRAGIRGYIDPFLYYKGEQP